MFKDLCQKVVNVQGHNTCFMSFSAGKDSIASFLRIYESNIFSKYVLFYYYLIPGMSWVEEYLSYFEKKFNLKIIKLPNPALLRMLENGLLQTPLRVKAIDDLYKNGGGWAQYNYTQMMQYIKEDEGLPESTLCAVGVKANDSFMRRAMLKKHGPIVINQKKWYPIHDYTNSDIKDIIKKHNVEYPLDYELFGLTFDGLDYRFIKPISEKKPEDYKRIKELFPLVDLVIHRREKYYGNHIKRSKFNYNS